ncbi:glyoxalase [Corynebacterium lactis RW2-5]|uniref:Glyoxalase n=2 Tax=Corynebacterium lactis TaxID=1231000 RepID=A0A0K2H046_9CORY|nr:glyoxalase [Corynebacterium lactis RW2-5]
MAPMIARILDYMSESHIPVPHKYVVAVDHVGVAVPDFDAAVEWYRANLGFINYHDEVNEEQGVHEAMLGPADKVEGGTLVQILAPLNEESTIAKYLDKKGPGIQQYAVRVTDLEALMAHLKEQGTRVLYPEPKIGTAGSRINFVHPKDAGGVLLELVEPAE